MKLQIDWIGIKGAIRTAGALMIGNVFVAIFILSRTNYGELSFLLFSGITAIIGASIEIGEKP